MVSRLAHSSLPFLRLTRNFATKAEARPSRLLLGRYTDTVPVDLARVQSGSNVKLRDYETQKELKRFSYDLKLQKGIVVPADGPEFIGPNGCSLRPPFSPTFQEVVRNFRGANIIISVIPRGTILLPTLQILHEHSDHYSLQCTKPMTLDELNDELTAFITSNARTMDKEQFDQEYPFSLDF